MCMLSFRREKEQSGFDMGKVHGEGYWQVAERCPVRTGNIPLGAELPMEERRTTASSGMALEGPEQERLTEAHGGPP